MGGPQDAHPNDGSSGLDSLASLLPTLMMMRSGAGGSKEDTPWLQLLLAVLLPVLLRLILPKLQNALNQVCPEGAGGTPLWVRPYRPYGQHDPLCHPGL